jgi:hypothetical protein
MRNCKTRPDNPVKIQRLIPRARVADLLGICARTCKRYEARRLLTPHVINSRLTSYPETEVLKLITDARAAGADHGVPA